VGLAALPVSSLPALFLSCLAAAEAPVPMLPGRTYWARAQAEETMICRAG
jgi:hypothetical protein